MIKSRKDEKIDEIFRMRQKLDKVMDILPIYSDEVIKLSRQMDKLILNYYGKKASINGGAHSL